jgi:hypothetical protein
MSSLPIKIDTDALLKTISEEAKDEYSDLWKDLKEEQKDLFLRITGELQREMVAYSFGPAEEKEKHAENLKSLRNALSAIEGVAAIKTYRRTINLVGRVIVAIARATIAAAIAL